MRLYNKTEIFNFALGELGSTINIADADTVNSTVGNVLKRNYDMAVSQVLDLHDWSCFRKTAALNLVTTNPTSAWGYQYDVPEDCHTVRRISQDNFFPRVEEYEAQKIPYEQVSTASGILINTNLVKAWAEYTARPSEGEALISYFAEAVACQLAVRCAPAIITNNWLKIKSEFLRDARNKISLQIATDITKQPAEQSYYFPFSRARVD
jgi:hypothetical protein